MDVAAVQLGREAGVGGGRREDNAVERLVQEVLLGDRLVGTLGQEHHPVAQAFELVVQRRDDMRVEGVGQVGHDDADPPRGTGGQGAAHFARHIVQRACRRL